VRVSLAPPVIAWLACLASLVCLVVWSHALGGCTLPAGEPCCVDDLDCAEGARCFEDRCALQCDDDSQCDEGELCVESALESGVEPGVESGVCRAAVRGAGPCGAEGA
jgi:hypothetical protein